VEFVNDCNLDNASSFTNSSAIWGGMDGNVSGSDRWKYRTACWAFTHASSHCTKRERQTGGNYTTLAPCVKWTNTTPYQMIPADGMTVQLLFDTHMDQSSDPCLIWRADGGIFTLDSATWDSDTLLTVRVNPIDNAYGTGTLVAEQQGAYSADCSYLHLDGDASGGASDWSIALKHDNLPAATLEGVDWKDGVFTWSVSSEADTRGYRVEGRTPPGDWQAVGGLQPPGVGRRSLSVGSAYTEYRVVEVETHGHEIIGNTVSTAPRSALPTYPERTLAELQAALRDRAARGPEHEASTRFNGEKIVVFTPLAWTSDIQYLMGYLAGWYGITYQMETVEQFGTPENRLYGIKNRISQLYGQGYRYVLLVGDASDWQYFDGPYTAEYWPNAYWESIRQGYFTAGYPHGGDPSLNVIPTVMVKDQLPREQGVAYYQPYYQLSDLLSYGDVDADGLPDLAVGRWPFTTEQEVAAACYKTLEYIDHGGWGYDQPYTVNVFLGDVNHYEGGEAQHVTAVANAIKSHFSTGTTFRSQAQS
jgi:hypothetical protein